MKKMKISLRLLILLLAVIGFACSPVKDNSFTITGEIVSAEHAEVEVFFYKNMITNEMEKAVAQLDENNRFTVGLNSDISRLVFVSIPGRTIVLYVKPGETVDVTIDASDADIQAMVTGSSESAMLIAYNHQIDRNYGQMLVINRAREMDPDTFTAYANEVYEIKREFLDTYPGSASLDPAFLQLMRSTILYEKLGSLFGYAGMYRRNMEEGQPDLPEAYFAFANEAGLIDDMHLPARSYVNFLNQYIGHHLSDPRFEGTALSESSRRFVAALELLSGSSRDFVLANQLISIMIFGGIEETQMRMEEFLTVAGDPDIRGVVEAEYNKLLALTPGNPAPDFTLTDINGETVSLSDFRGKVVYLDFWASWCGPCMREVPHAKELKKRMADQNDLVFLYVSIDTDEQAWRNTVAEHQMQGVHLNVSGAREGAPVLYNVKGVPTFFIIGRDGMIYDNRPPRPSNPLVDEVLLSALAR